MGKHESERCGRYRFKTGRHQQSRTESDRHGYGEYNDTYLQRQNRSVQGNRKIMAIINSKSEGTCITSPLSPLFSVRMLIEAEHLMMQPRRAHMLNTLIVSRVTATLIFSTLHSPRADNSGTLPRTRKGRPYNYCRLSLCYSIISKSNSRLSILLPA